jgi:hypothetical protein
MKVPKHKDTLTKTITVRVSPRLKSEFEEICERASAAGFDVGATLRDTRSRIQPGRSAKNWTRSIKRPECDQSRQSSTDTMMQIAFRPRPNYEDQGTRFLRRLAVRGSNRFCGTRKGVRS